MDNTIPIITHSMDKAECPICGEKTNIGMTDYCDEKLRRIIPTFYCRNCLIEYEADGTILGLVDEDYTIGERERLAKELRLSLWSQEIKRELTKAELRAWFNKIGLNKWCQNLNLYDVIEIAEEEGFTVTT